MTKGEKEFLNLWLKEKKSRLAMLHENHRVANEVYDARRHMLMADIDDLEKQLESVKK